LTHPSGLFRGTTLRPLRGAAPSNFYTPATPKLYFQSDFGRQTASSWGSAYISSYFYVSLNGFCI